MLKLEDFQKIMENYWKAWETQDKNLLPSLFAEDGTLKSFLKTKD